VTFAQLPVRERQKVALAFSLRGLHAAVVVAVVSVRMVQVVIHQVIRVVAMRNRFVAAAGAMPVSVFMRPAVVVGRTIGGVGGAHRQDVLIHVVSVHVMQVTVVKVIGVAVMLNRGMTTALPVLVVVVRVRLALAHGSSPGIGYPEMDGNVPAGGYRRVRYGNKIPPGEVRETERPALGCALPARGVLPRRSLRAAPREAPPPDVPASGGRSRAWKGG
jgi:hypothetical protein